LRPIIHKISWFTILTISSLVHCHKHILTC